MQNWMRTQFNRGMKYKNYIPWLVIACFTIAYVSLSFNRNIWGDEAYTIDLLRNCVSMKDVWQFTANDVHPPFYYMIAQIVTNLFGINLTLLKLVSIIPILGTMAIGATYVTKKFGLRTGILFILMLGVMPCSMEYALQVRMYAWTIFLVTLCAIGAYEAYVGGRIRDYTIMGAAGVACAYSHYFAFVSIIWIYGFLFLALLFTKRKELLKWFFLVIGSVICYSPWLPYMKIQVTGVSASYWIPPITKDVIKGYFGWFFETDLPYAPRMLQMLFIIAGIFIVIRMIQNRKKREALTKDIFCLACLFVPVLTMVTGVVLSNIIRPIFIIRYVVPCAGLLCLFFAHAMSRLDKKLFLALVLFCCCLGVVDYEDTYKEEYQSTTVEELERFLELNMGENDYIVYNYKGYDFVYEFYFDKEKMIYIEDLDYSMDFDNLWFLDTGFNPVPTQEELVANNLAMFYISNHEIEYNAFSLYQITKQPEQ